MEMNNQSKFAYSSKKSYSQESFEGDKLEIRATEARHFGTPKMTLTSLSLWKTGPWIIVRL